jgi:DNA polymerase-1
VVTRAASGSDSAALIGAESMRAGITLARWFAEEARRVYAVLGEAEGETADRELIEYVRARGGRITTRELQKSNNRKYRDAESARTVLAALVEAGLGTWVHADPGPRGGQAAVWFVVNPCTTHDTTDSTGPNGALDDDGSGGRPHDTTPSLHDTTSQNSREKPGTVGSVVRRAGDPSGQNGPPAGGGEPGEVVSCRTEVVSCEPPVSEGTDVAGETGGQSPPPAGAAEPSLPPFAPPDYTPVTDAAGLPAVIRAIGGSTAVGLDCETTGLSAQADRVRLLSLATGDPEEQRVYVIDCFAVDPAPLWPALAAVPVVGHNIAFDLRFLARLGFTARAAADTMLLSQVLHARAGRQGGKPLKRTLQACCERELGVPLAKGQQRSDWSGELTSDQLAYAATDAAVVRPLMRALVPPLAEAGLERTAQLESRALPAVAWLGGAGVAFDQPAWDALAAVAAADAARLWAELDGLWAELDGLAPPHFTQASVSPTKRNWNSVAQVKAVLAALGFEVPNTEAETLAALDHPLVSALLAYRAAAKRASTYGPRWAKGALHDGRLYADWRQVGAKSGRMACARPNLQNLPRDPAYRRCFVAPEGKVLVKGDYSQIELRIAAKVADDRAMLGAYRRGDDLHALTARLVLGKEDVSKADRQLAKAVNFGLVYGMGAPAFRVYARAKFGVALTEAEAVGYRNKFFAAYPGLRRWHDAAKATGGRPIEVRTLGGRRVLNVIQFAEKLNLGVQGTGADGLKASLALLWERRHQCPGALLVLAVHDEIVVECDRAQADAAAAWLKKAMLDGMAPLVAPVPVVVDVSSSRTWAGD